MKKMLFILLSVTTSLSFSCEPGRCCADTKAKPVLEQSKSQKKKKAIKKAYSNVAKKGGFICSSGGCCGGGSSLSESVGYSKEELAEFSDANLGLGCGHPINLGQIKREDTVLDLGSGAGLDCFLAARKTGKKGKVIGVDMTKEMVIKARKNAKKYNYSNVIFRLGDIEKLPIKSNSVDVVISNCVINLAPHKEKVFSEVYRVLKKGGHLAISDVVLTKKLTKAQAEDVTLLCACVSGAILKEDYLTVLKKLGFDVTIVEEDKGIGQKWFGKNDLPIISLKFIATKK